MTSLSQDVRYSDPSIVGSKIQLDGKTVEVVGVMPPGFDHPLLWGPFDIWQPLRVDASSVCARCAGCSGLSHDLYAHLFEC